MSCRKQKLLKPGTPVPNEASLAAGARLMEWLREADEDASFLFLISGGASSFVEVLRDSIDLEFLQRTNRWLLSSGLAIEQMNQVRRSLSLIKGGGLLSNLAGRSASVWLISDVAKDDLATIGSGLLYPASERPIIDGLPDWLNEVVSKPSDSMTGNLAVPPHDILANIELLCERVAEEARARGMTAQIQDVQLCGDAAFRGEEIAAQLEHLPSGIHIWGGETTVQLPSNPGRGGRNQHLALAAAIKLSGQKSCGLLALGSDGVDGNTEDAGAMVDGDTVSRGEIAGLNAVDSLSRADSGTFLEASGDLVSTGPTGTNVQDIVIAWKE